MSTVAPFHSINEDEKPVSQRVYHNNSACGPAKEIPYNERVLGTGGYRLCDDCARINADEKSK